MEELNGLWVTEKTLSTGVDGTLKMAGLNWALRKAVGLATVRLDISIYPEDKDNETSSSATVIDILTTATGSLSGTREKRVSDWSPQDQKDYMFGSCQHRTCFVHAGSNDGDGDGKNTYPQFDLQTQTADEEKVRKFLRGEILEDGSSSAWSLSGVGSPDGKAVWVHTFIRNVNSGSTAEQIWGFEEINGKRYHTRRVVSSNGSGQYVMGRVVYGFLGKGSGSA
ncbi:hypothetical protein BDW59DRAFT_152162 [Aspergillus cavernicola]|uniref:LCCL domain-containing protein n=1 Tax=Aspergillus cavernicola TaxID=176166 RepID=A0ABR4HRU0_9EURO